MSDKKLTVKQEAFCLHYAKTGNATESYNTAGYKATNSNIAGVEAHKLLKNPKIEKRLKKIAEEVKTEKIADIQEIQEFLTSVMRRENRENVVVTISKQESSYKPDEEGKMRKYTTKEEIPMVVPIPAKLSDANKAAETLAKMQGAFDNKLQVELTVPIFEGEECLED